MKKYIIPFSKISIETLDQWYNNKILFYIDYKEQNVICWGN